MFLLVCQMVIANNLRKKCAKILNWLSENISHSFGNFSLGLICQVTYLEKGIRKYSPNVYRFATTMLFKSMMSEKWRLRVEKTVTMGHCHAICWKWHFGKLFLAGRDEREKKAGHRNGKNPSQLFDYASV